MKKLLRIGSALLALMLLLSVTVLAADPPKEAGIYDLVLESDYADIPVKVLLATQDGATDSGIAAEEAEIDGGAVRWRQSLVRAGSTRGLQPGAGPE